MKKKEKKALQKLYYDAVRMEMAAEGTSKRFAEGYAWGVCRALESVGFSELETWDIWHAAQTGVDYD